MYCLIFFVVIFQCVYGKQSSLEPIVSAADLNNTIMMQTLSTGSLKSMLHDKNFISQVLTFDPEKLNTVIQLIKELRGTSQTDLDDINDGVSDALSNKREKDADHKARMMERDNLQDELKLLKEKIDTDNEDIAAAEIEIAKAKEEMDIADTVHQTLVNEQSDQMPGLDDEILMLKQVLALLDSHHEDHGDHTDVVSLLQTINSDSLKSVLQKKDFQSLSLDPVLLDEVIQLIHNLMKASQDAIDNLESKVAAALADKVAKTAVHTDKLLARDNIIESRDASLIEVKVLEQKCATAIAAVTQAKTDLTQATDAYNVLKDSSAERLPGLEAELAMLDKVIALLEAHQEEEEEEEEVETRPTGLLPIAPELEPITPEVEPVGPEVEPRPTGLASHGGEEEEALRAAMAAQLAAEEAERLGRV